MHLDRSVAVVIPALNEEGSIASVVGGIDRSLVDRIVVADNGSTDATAARAAEAGALVVCEPRRGYGSACLKGLAAVPDAGILVFLDGDGSDNPAEIRALLAFMVEQQADLVIGSRVLAGFGSNCLTLLQRFGNALTCTLVRWFFGVRYTDLGPFRAIRRDALARLEMADPDFGWTIEMQVKAAQRGLRIAEMPVSSRPRVAGRSKVSGTFRGSWNAGRKILGYVFSAKVSDLRRRLPRGDSRSRRPSR
jgi:glycosyltransferase involved in cell wall biosynthesis